MPLLLHICNPYSEPAMFWHFINKDLNLTVHQLLFMYVIASLLTSLHLGVVVFCIFWSYHRGITVNLFIYYGLYR